LDLPAICGDFGIKAGKPGPKRAASFGTSDDSVICNPDLSQHLEVRNDLETARHVTVGLAPSVKLFKIERLSPITATRAWSRRLYCEIDRSGTYN